MDGGAGGRMDGDGSVCRTEVLVKACLHLIAYPSPSTDQLAPTFVINRSRWLRRLLTQLVGHPSHRRAHVTNRVHRAAADDGAAGGRPQHRHQVPTRQVRAVLRCAVLCYAVCMRAVCALEVPPAEAVASRAAFSADRTFVFLIAARSQPNQTHPKPTPNPPQSQQLSCAATPAAARGASRATLCFWVTWMLRRCNGSLMRCVLCGVCCVLCCAVLCCAVLCCAVLCHLPAVCCASCCALLELCRESF